MTLLPADSERRRHVVLGMLLVGLSGYAAYEYLHVPGAEQAAALTSRLAQLQLYNRSALGDVQGSNLNELEHQLLQYQQDWSVLQTLIARPRELPDLLDAISAEAEQSGVGLLLLQPSGLAEEDVFVRHTYDLAVVGDYHDIGYFLARIAALPRMILPSGLSLLPRADAGHRAGVSLEGRFTIDTYVVPMDGSAEEVVGVR